MRSAWGPLVRIGNLYGKKKAPWDKKDEAGDIAYWHPLHREYILIPQKKASSLKRYAKHKKGFLYTFRRAAQAGYIVQFRGYRKPCIKGVNEMDVVLCKKYSQRVTPPVCMARILLYPCNRAPSEKLGEELDRLQRRYFYSTDDTEKKRIRKEVRELTELYDPYPYCRGGCPMGKEFYNNSCLGAEFDPTKESCNTCDDRNTCCQLMRIRIARILVGEGKEVEVELVEGGALLNPTVANLKHTMINGGSYLMAKKKKTEEVVEKPIEQPEAATATEGATMTKAEKRKARKEAAKKQAEAEKAAAEAKAKGTDPEISGLLGQLAIAKKEKDQAAASKIRSKLRAKGYKLRKA